MKICIKSRKKSKANKLLLSGQKWSLSGSFYVWPELKKEQVDCESKTQGHKHSKNQRGNYYC